MRKFIAALALLIGVIFIITRFAEVHSIVLTFQQGDLSFILLALLVEGVWMLNLGASFYTIYKILGMEESRSYLVRLAMAANFINIVTLTGGMTGMAIFIADARRRGHSPAKAAIAGALSVLFDYGAFICVLLIGLAVLSRRNDLTWPQMLASAVLISVAATLAILIYLASRSAERLGRVLSALARLVNSLARPFLHREYLSIERAHTFAEEAAEGACVFRDQPARLWMPFALALSKQALLITVFFLVFLAFKIPMTAGSLIAAFSMGYLFLIVSPTPSGLGVVEGVLTLTLTTLRIPVEAATVVALAYRGVTFWFPLLVGMIAFRGMEWLHPQNRLEIN